MSAALLGTIAVRLAAKTAEFNRDIKKASGKLGSISSAAANVAKKSAIAFASMAGGLGVLTKFASEEIAAERQLAAAFKATGKSLDMERFTEFAAGLQAITTTGDDAIMGMGALMGSFGLGQTQIEALIPGVLDLAAATGNSADTIAQQLSRAVVEGTAGLDRYGIFLTASEEKTLKLGTQSERTAFLVSKLANFQGQAAVEASTAAGRFQQLSTAFSNVLAELGKIVDTPLATFFGALRGVVQGVSDAIGGLSPGTKEMIANILLGTTVVLGIATAVSTLTALLIPAGIAFLGFLAPALPIIAAVALALIAVIAVVGALKLFWDQKAKAMGDSWRQFVSNTASDWEKMVGFLKSTFSGFNDWITEKLGIISGVILGMSPDDVGANIRKSQAAGGIAGKVGAAVSAGGDTLGKAANWVETELKADFGSFMKSLKAGVGVFTGLYDSAKNAMGGLLDVGAAATIAAGGPADGRLPTRDMGGGSVGRGDAVVGGGSATSLRQVIDDGLYDASVEMADAFGLSGEAASSMGSAFQGGMSVLVSAMAQGGERISATMQGAEQGFASGGPWGALFGAIIGLLSTTQSFKAAMKLIDDNLGTAADKLDEFMTPITELLGSVLGLIGVFTEILDGMAGLEIVMQVFSKVLGAVSIIIESIAWGIAKVWNWILDLVVGILDAFGQGDMADDVRAKRIDTDAMKQDIKDDWKELIGETVLEASGGEQFVPLGDEIDKTTEAFKDLNAELSNVPTGFKMGLRSFQSDEGTMLVPGGDEGGSGDVTINVYANDLDEAARKMEENAAFRQFMRGQKVPHRTPYQVPREGG